MRSAKASDTKFVKTPSTPTRCLVADGGQAFEPYGFTTKSYEEKERGRFKLWVPFRRVELTGTASSLPVRPGGFKLFQVAD